MRDKGADAVAEFRAFVAETVADGAHALAELAELQNNGGPGAIPQAHAKATSARDLLCRRSGGWAVFYTAGTIGGVFQVTVLHVAEEAGAAFGVLEAEAVRRMRLI